MRWVTQAIECMIWQPLSLTSEWVALRPLEASDFELLYQVASDPLIWEQHPNPDRYKKEIFSNYFQGALESQGALLVLDRTGQIIGCTRFYEHDPLKKEVKIGYTFFARACWGKPFNSSTKKLMLDFAFQFVDNVLFQVGANNIRSRKAMEKLGAVESGQEEVAYYGESPKLNMIYEIRATDWKV